VNRSRNSNDGDDNIVLAENPEIVEKEDPELFFKLEHHAKRTRKWIVKMTHAAGSGHPGGSLSAAEMLTVLYFHIMRHDPAKPDWLDRDRFVMSKGHGAPALYATLAQAGYFPEEELLTLRKFGTRLQGHPSMNRLPGIDMSTGSLGQGLSVANGMALGARLNKKNYHVYALLGDGECQEGQIWEAAMSAAHYKLDNVTALLDRNCYQIDGETECIMSLDSLASKWESFGWHVFDVDGHDFTELIDALKEARKVKGKPQIIVARTVKGKGVSFMEQNPDKFHGNAPDDDELEKALVELGGEP
jgi:transketolase